MRNEDNAARHRIALKDLLLGKGIQGLGAIKRARASSKPDQVRVYDPEVRFISLSNSLQVRRLSEQAK